MARKKRTTSREQCRQKGKARVRRAFKDDSFVGELTKETKAGRLNELLSRPATNDYYEKLQGLSLEQAKEQAFSDMRYTLVGMTSSQLTFCRGIPNQSLVYLFVLLQRVLVPGKSMSKQLRALGYEYSEFMTEFVQADDMDGVKSMFLFGIELCGRLLLHYASWREFNCNSYVYSSSLATMLQYTRLDNLPTEHLQLPYETIELSFPSSVMTPFPATELVGNTLRTTTELPPDKIEGLLVREVHAKGGKRVWVIVPFDDDSSRLVPLAEIKLGVGYNNTLGEVIKDECDRNVQEDEARRPFFSNLFNFLAASIVYITMSDADAILGENSEEYRIWAETMAKLNMTRKQRKEFERRERVIKESNRIYLGRSFKIIDRHIPPEEEETMSTGEKRSSPRMHWRKGHFHGYWVKDGDGKSLITKWVQPTLVNPPGGGPLLESRTGMR